jgi:D-sedoheptulose 7-phosphate isomerase
MIDALNANAQEGHLIALHALCRAFDLEVGRRSPAVPAGVPKSGMPQAGLPATGLPQGGGRP